MMLLVAFFGNFLECSDSPGAYVGRLDLRSPFFILGLALTDFTHLGFGFRRKYSPFKGLREFSFGFLGHRNTLIPSWLSHHCLRHFLHGARRQFSANLPFAHLLSCGRRSLLSLPSPRDFPFGFLRMFVSIGSAFTTGRHIISASAKRLPSTYELFLGLCERLNIVRLEKNGPRERVPSVFPDRLVKCGLAIILGRQLVCRFSPAKRLNRSSYIRFLCFTTCGQIYNTHDAILYHNCGAV